MLFKGREVAKKKPSEELAMQEGIYIAASGAFKQEKNLNVIANNLANLGNAAFKRDGLVFTEKTSSFRSLLNFTETEPSQFNQDRPKNGASYVGVASFYTDHSQGSLKKTGNTLDLAIEGDGYFVIQTPAGERYTRNGNLILDAEGFLATQMGNRLLGPKGEPIQIDTAGGSIDIDSKGFISVGSGLENQPAGQLKLAAIEAKSNLTKEGNGLYKLTGGGTVKEGAKNFSVRQGFLELSNVNSVEEMTKMITTLRAFEAYQKVIQAIDGADDLAVNSIGRIA